MKRIGLLGGSFNPAHAGHLHISREAIKRLSLSEVWWLVSPKNPLKAADELAPYATRLTSAQAVATDPRIHVTDIEAVHHLHYTVDTLRFLKRRYPRHTFVWLMGADNLPHFHRWRHWQAIVRLVPIAILDRVPFAFRGMHGRFALAKRRYRVAAGRAAGLARRAPPAWIYLIIPRHPLSGTHLRKSLGPRAFVRHNEP